MDLHLDLDVVQKYVSGVVSDEARPPILSHLDRCQECRLLVVQASALASVAAAPRPAVPGKLPVVSDESYLFERELARGGLGKILSARHLPLDRVVAVKELITSDPEQQRRFVNEALVTASLQHPGIVPIHEAGYWPSGEPFYTMKLVSGKTLQEVLADAGSLDERLALLPRIIAVGEALAYAHDRGVIHRDLKPGNILIGEFGETVLIDWGLAKRIEPAIPMPGDVTPWPLGSIEESTAGSVVGTPRYMSPEQARGAGADARSDVYSLGVILYELLTGISPYSGRDGTVSNLGGHELEIRILAGQILPVEEREPAAPRDLVTITRRALAFHPGDRYPSAKDLIDDLHRFTTGQLISSGRYTSRDLFMRWLRRHARFVGVAAAAMIALAAVGATSAIRVGRARHDAQTSLARLELDEGRRAYLEGSPLLSLAYVAAAIRDGADGPIARYLLARATASVRPLRHALMADAGGSYDAAFSPDGKLLATGGADGHAVIWDAATGARLHTLEGGGTVLSVSWSPAGDRLVSAGLDGVLRVWDPATGLLVASLQGHRGYVPGVRFSADGARLVSWDLMGQVRIWDAVHGTLLHLLEAHAARVASVDIAPAGDRLLTIGNDGLAKVWSMASGALICASPAGAAGFVPGGFDPAARRFVVGSGSGKALVHDAADCSVTLTIAADAGELTVVSFDPSGTRILASGFKGSRLWDARTGALLNTLGESEPTQSAAFSPDGSRLATGSHGGAVRIWNLADGGPLALFAGHGAHVRAISWSPDGRSLASAGADGVARIWDTRANFVARSATALRNVHLLRNGVLLATTAEAGDVVRFGALTGAFTPVAAGVCPPGSIRGTGLCLIGEGVVLRVTDGVAELVDLATGTARWRDPAQRVVAAGLAPGSARAATVSSHGEVRVTEVSTGREIRVIKPGKRVSGVSFADDRRLVVMGSSEIAIWDLESGERLATLPGVSLPRTLSTLPITVSGDRVVIPGMEREAAVYDLGSLRRVTQLHGPPMLGGIVSDEMGLIVSRHFDDIVRVWDEEGGQLLDELRPGELGSLTIDREHQRILTVDFGGDLQAWPIDRDERTTAEVERFVASCVPYRVERGEVVPRPLDAAGCKVD